MDEVKTFFDFTKEFRRVPVPRGCVSGNIAANAGKADSGRPIKREYFGDQYSKQIADQERKRILEEDDPMNETRSSRHGATSSTCMDELEDLSDEDDVKPKTNRIDDNVYTRYNFNLNRDESLPIHDNKDQILAAIRKYPVVVLEGDTGCGKTTQVPQYILDEAYGNREYCKIVCTQPRRIAAISIARRVCQERKWEEGSVVGFQVGLHAKVSEDTRLLYCTTGVLLQKLIKEKSLRHFTHIILDEVHERDQEMDFLLIVIRKLLTTNSRGVKIVLMSATINAGEFSDYFTIRRNPAPVLRVDSRRLYQVREFYLSDLGRINSTNTDVDVSDPGISKEMYNIAYKLIIVIDNIEKQEASVSMDPSSLPQTSILIFLPGINEIDQMCHKLESLSESVDNNVKLFPIRLHSLISPDEQSKVFNHPPTGFRKVILATNIAESSITVPDVKYVIDFCLTKSLITDTATNFSSLQLHWASRANCRQRAGRAGRVMNGRVYRMVSKDFYEHYMEEFGTAEMLRCPLENAVLKAKMLDMGPPPDILGLAMTPPNLSDIHNTILTLKEVGALFTTVNGAYSIQDGDLSFMGRVMAVMPLDIRLTRLILLGYIFSAMEEAIIIAAGLSVRSIFRSGVDRRGRENTQVEAYIQKLVWADGSGSDLFAILRAYRLWSSMREQQNIHEEASEHYWANRYFINLRSMKEMHLLVLELRERLQRLGIREQHAYQRVCWIDREKIIILKIIIAGAFYPNYFTRSNLNDTERERGIYHTLCGNDPCNTVYFTGFNTRHIGQLYTGSIKELFKFMRIHPKNIEVRFQPGAERVFVTFKKDQDADDDGGTYRLLVPGRVCPDVYKAVRMRMLGIRTSIRVMDPRNEVRYAEERRIGTMVEGVWQPVKKQIKNPELVVLPSVFQKMIRGYITHIESCSKFYFQPLTEMERLREIHALLNSPENLQSGRFQSPAAIAKGMMVAAPFENKYHRARIVKVLTAARQHCQFKVFFVDYGNTDVIDFEQLRRFSRHCESLHDIPPRMFECRLVMVEPSTVKCPSGKWPDEAMEFMQQTADAGVVEIEVYSVVSGISNVIIKTATGTLNDILVEKGLAHKSDENYMSKADHDFRLRKQVVATRFLDEDHSKQNEEYLRSIQPEADVEVDPPPREYCTKTINLRGPYSALETKIFSAVRIGTWKSVHVERDSVNSVLIDTDPQDVHERLIVAASITEAQNTETLTARATTLMPNIHGFSALMTLLFCPTMQIKRNINKTKYVAILAGLGYNKDNYKPLYEEHDIVLNLDADITKDDLELINQLRYCMDTMLYTDPSDERPTILPNMRADLSAKIKNLIIRLLNRNRKYIETHVDSHDNVWQPYDVEDLIETEPIYGHRSLFPMHSALKLYDEKFDRIHSLGVHCQELHRLCQFDGPIQTLTCQLCNQNLENIVQLRIHLLSQLHRDREHQIRFKMPR
ncbi:probable ATP-dependent RNA helicase spindle-E [Bactrocera dorsalis]|uniref:Probable ATP-dependent RNA helicase spindle-E n=2 Tax=Bactrocera dorsalis TaxID=27457 RepID=A0A6I9VAL6_BACDO|nr:probable ATP-dependent RNA helicase spindle-E [Bactrocera dorsalis]